MGVFRAFQAKQGQLEPYDVAWGSGQTWMDVLERERFRSEASMTLGREAGGLRVEVHEAESLEAPYQEFAFVALVFVGNTAYPVFCPDLIELLQFLQSLVSIIELDLRCVGEAALASRLTEKAPHHQPFEATPRLPDSGETVSPFSSSTGTVSVDNATADRV